MQSRRQDAQAAKGEQTLAADDQEHLRLYAKRLDEAITVLRQEVAAIGNGKYHIVGELFSEKVELLKWLELRAPVVEPFLTHPTAQEMKIPEKLRGFKAVLKEDSELLSRMANAAATIVREIHKVLDRNSLEGIYGSSGEKLSKNKNRPLALDREI
jgi:hypothetical protein